MAQPPRTKHPLDILQGMINGILIETGRALKASNKDGRRALAGTNTRLQSTIPSAVETFQQALDELECDILRAKSVLSRDLEELRTKRLALENPVTIPANATQNSGIVNEISEPEARSGVENNLLQSIQAEPLPVNEELKLKSPEMQLQDKVGQQTHDGLKESPSKASNAIKENQVPSPPMSFDEVNTNTKPTGLGIKTEVKPNADNPTTNGPQDPSIDALFEIPDNNNTNVDLNFDNMDFSLSTDTNTQTQDQQKTQSDDFDLSTFGNTSQDFNISNLNVSKDTNVGSNGNAAENKQPEDLNLGTIAGGGESMDLDLSLDMVGAEDSAFDDMFFGNEGVMSAGGEMEHDTTFDNAFFGVN